MPRADLEEVPGTLTEAPGNCAAQGKLPEAASVPEIPGAGTLGKDSRILQLELPQGRRREPSGDFQTRRPAPPPPRTSRPTPPTAGQFLMGVRETGKENGLEVMKAPLEPYRALRG